MGASGFAGGVLMPPIWALTEVHATARSAKERTANSEREDLQRIAADFIGHSLLAVGWR
jgi:hypothetical protein